MAVNHENAHRMIEALSFTDEGRKLVHGLEAMRYYHRDGLSYHLGDGSRLVISINEDPWTEDDNKMIGVVYIPGFRNGKPGHENLFINKASWPGHKTEAAIFWSYPEDTDEVWEVVKDREDVKNGSFIEADLVMTKAMRTPGAPTLIPRELAEWAADLIVNCSDWGERDAGDCRPVWREITIKNHQGDDRDGYSDTLSTLIKVPSAGIDWLILTDLDEDGSTVREIPIKSDDIRGVFSRKLHQEKVMNKRSHYTVTEKPLADWEMELLDGDAKQWEMEVQRLSETHCKFANMGNGLLMRDLVNAVRDISTVRPEDLPNLRTADIYDHSQKNAICRVVATYRDGDINNDIIEDDCTLDSATPTFFHSFDLLASMRKMLNMVTNYKHHDYFDSVSPVQALVHLVMENYEPHDIEF